MDNIQEMKQEDRRLLKALAGLVVVMLILFIVGMFFLKPAEVVVQGQADTTSVRISGKLPGRVVSFYVQEGDRVKKGDT